jgi:hypothetical protein
VFLNYQREEESHQVILLLFHLRTSHFLEQPQIEVVEKLDNIILRQIKMSSYTENLKSAAFNWRLVFGPKNTDSWILVSQFISLYELKRWKREATTEL